MKTVQHVLVCVLLAALTALAVSATLLVRGATTAVAAVPVEIRELRGDLTGQVAAARRDLFSRSDRQVTALRRDVMAETERLRETADRRVGDTLARADAALATVDGVRRDLQPVLANSAAIASQVNGALPLYLDCDHNPDCVFNRYVGVSQGIERAARNFGEASQEFRGVLPGMLTTWDHIGANVSGTAGNIERLTKPHWYDRLIGYGLNGMIIYRNLNPAANLTVTGAQFIASRP
jgi:hypothetical protein